ncbi:MAG: glycosyltransferase [Pseudanabaenaceae cyanobacterium bins.68]|nr:glycosyltransferase [Pseudanabaenaceae cyanobacterium bins.68]
MAAVNSLATMVLLLYGLNAYWLVLMYCGRRLSWKPKLAFLGQVPQLALELVSNGYSGARLDPVDYPVVTVQLPIFNERYVARRLLDAVCGLEYPRDRLYIQVLDDSVDDTREILKSAVEDYRRAGIWVDYIHRCERTGYKAGALAAAMELVQGDFIAIFDADFVPARNWLKLTMSNFGYGSDRIGVVQTRWSHLNRQYSWLTELQAVALDGHFAIEQQTRFEMGYFLNFNGTAGIWRRQAIEDAGGWQADTLAEDMDLSYRAQLRGWRVVYDHDVEALGELPVAIAAFKVQQFRWAKGGIQCAKKLLPKIWASSRGWDTKIQATMHLTGYCAHPLMLSLLLLSVPLLANANPVNQAGELIQLWGWLMLLPTFGPPLLFMIAQRQLYPYSWQKQCWGVAALPILWTGLSFSNTRAVLAGLFDRRVTFWRTPKYGGSDRSYRLPLDLYAWVEVALAFYSGLAFYLCLEVGLYLSAVFVLLYVLGYGYVGGLTLWQSWRQRG